jgi:mRNA interferase RelE/StbE
MKVEVQKSFEKDVFSIRDKKLAAQLNRLIEELENCPSLLQVRHLKRMTAKGNYYRIRIGNYRLGLKAEGGMLILLRFMHRKEIYKYFP